METPTSPPNDITVAQLARPAQWIALGLGVLLLLIGFGGQQAFGPMIAACFMGIVSRIAQAEFQHRERMRK